MEIFPMIGFISVRKAKAGIGRGEEEEKL